MPEPVTIVALQAWVLERLENCERLAGEKSGTAADGWRDDARHFRAILANLESLRLIAEHARAPAPGFTSR